MLRELSPGEFTEEALGHIFRHVEGEVNKPGRADPAYFYSHWRDMMEVGVARTWADDGCVCGGFMVPDVYNGRMRALILFWFASPDARRTGRPTQVRRAFEQAAKEAGCETISIAAYQGIQPERMRALYEADGYGLTETIFEKPV